jgi:hypothetical protein
MEKWYMDFFALVVVKACAMNVVLKMIVYALKTKNSFVSIVGEIQESIVIYVENIFVGHVLMDIMKKKEVKIFVFHVIWTH